jgi:hypothetical protein
MMNVALNLLQKYSDLSPMAQELLNQHVSKIKLRSGETLSTKTSIPMQMYFAEEGSFLVKRRIYGITKNYLIRANNTSFIHFDAYRNPKESSITITSFDDVSIYAIPFNVIEILAFENEEINKLYTAMLCYDFQIYSSDYKQNSCKNSQQSKFGIIQSMARKLHRIAAIFV